MARQLYRTGRQRRLDIERAVAAVEYGDVLLVVALILLLFGLLLLGVEGSLDLVVLRWGLWGVAVVGAAAMGLLRMLLAASLAPGQVTGAAVDAMVVDGPDEGLVLFMERPVEVVCLSAVRRTRWVALLDWRARVMVRAIWGRVWRRSTLLPVIGTLLGRACFLPRRLPEPLS